jgi:hypothetical protein
MLVFGIVAAGVAGTVLLVLWNSLMPAIFGLRSINFWQALGLLVLSRILFGGWGRAFRKPRFARGLQSLTPEERQRFREAMLDRVDPRRE